MPGGDRTGPLGRGPRTGRGFGFCSGYQAPGYTAGGGYAGWGAGFGRGRGFWCRGGGGRGWRNMFYATGQPGWARSGYPTAAPPMPDAESEKRVLQDEAEALQAELGAIRQRLNTLEGSSEKE